MEKEFVTFEIAEKLKHIGFNYPCLAAFFKKIDGFVIRGCGAMMLEVDGFYQNEYFMEPNSIAAPLWQQVIDWLNEKHNIKCCPSHSEATGKDKYDLFILKDGKWEREFNPVSFYSQHEARQASIEKALSIITSL